MPRYHFHLLHGDELLNDEIGTELVNVTTAVQSARRMVGELFAEAMSERGNRWFGWTVQVVTADNRPVTTMLVPDEPQPA